MTNIVCENFIKLTKIPRPSGKEGKIADYLVEFAKERNLECFRDEYNNVIIKKKAKIENAKTIILQGHTDMVCEKEDGIEFDFDTMPIETYIEDGWIKAKGTTLGADNGVGASMILSMLDENTDNVNIEAVFTATEETSMNGANHIDASLLEGKTMINLDGTEESVVECACAGMLCLKVMSSFKKEKSELQGYRISIKNLAGGHSGESIHEARGNANKIIGTFLKMLGVEQIARFAGGTKYNVIPSSAECEFVTEIANENVENFFNSFSEHLKNNVLEIDKNVELKLEKLENKLEVLSKKDTKKFINYVCKFKNGVLRYDEEEFPIISNNFAVVDLDNEMEIKISIRSSNKKRLLKRISQIQKKSKGYAFEITESSPMFEYKENSPLRDIMIRTHKELFGTEPEVKKIHACMEGGVFSGKIENLDLAIMASTLEGIHSVKERANIDSMERTFNWLKKIIEEYAK